MANGSAPQLTAGIDLGDRHSQICFLDEEAEVVERRQIATTKSAFARSFKCERMRVAIEVGTHSAWIADLLTELGHEVFVANARDVALIHKKDTKNDINDAELLARLGRSDPKLLFPIQHRPAEIRGDLSVIRVRDAIVRSRTLIVNSMRGVAKSHGARLAKCSASSLHKKLESDLPAGLSAALEPARRALEALSEELKAYDSQIERLATEKYPETELLKQIAGVGTLTALAFRLTIGDPQRFKKSRDVGPYFGLRPRQAKSCDDDPELPLAKSGDGYMRRLLVGSAHYVLGPFGPDTALRRWGLSLCARGGKSAKKRAVVAVARKLAILMHRLWTTQEVYEPLRGVKREERVEVSNTRAEEPQAPAPGPGAPLDSPAPAIGPRRSAPPREGRRRVRRAQGQEPNSAQSKPRPSESHATPSAKSAKRTKGTLRRSAPPRRPPAGGTTKL
jgi:transposase